MKAIRVAPLIIVLLLFTAIFVNANVINVPSDKLTIQAGIDAANNGDTVLVEPGTYIENIDFLGKNIKLFSSVGPEFTIIVAPTSESRIINTADDNDTTVVSRSYSLFSDQAVVTMASGEPRGAEISGFTITGGGRSGIYCYGTSPIITNNIIAKNRSDYTNGGAAIDLNLTSGSLIKNNIMYDNEAHTYGAAIHLEYSQNDTICYNLLYDNFGYGDIRGLDAYSICYNNTINMPYYAGILNQRNGIVEVLNNIVVNSSDFAFQSSTDAEINASYNCTWNCPLNYSNCLPGPGAINADPLFVDESSHNYSLQSISPCIDAGHPDPLYNDQNGTRNDIGWSQVVLLEDLPWATNICYDPSFNNNHILSSTMNISWTYYDDEATSQNEYQIQIGTDNEWTTAEIWDSGPITSSSTSVLYGGAALDNRTVYFLRIRVNNGAQWGGWMISWFITHFNHIIYVPADFSTIQEGINFAIDFDTVVVAPGKYEESINFLGKRILLISSDGPEVTTIQAPISEERAINTSGGSDTTLAGKTYTIRSDQPVITFASLEPKGTEISGFKITGGGRSGIFCNGTSPTITNNIIVGNFSDYTNGGAGIDMNGTYGAKIKGNIFYGNEAHTYGAAIHMENSQSDTICYNLSFNNIGYGDIRCLDANSIIYNNTLIPVTWSGITNQHSESFVNARNNIIAFGTYGIASGEESITIAAYNDTWNNELGGYFGFTPDVGNIYDDPLFIDQNIYDFHLTFTSPCINAGDPNPFFNDPDSSRNDMGAFPVYITNYPCGDVNLNGVTDVMDIIALSDYYFNHGSAPEIGSLADLNCDYMIGLIDIVLLNMYIFHDGFLDCCN